MRVSDRVIEIVQDLECRHQGTDLSINGRTLTGVLRDIAKRARVEEDARSSLRSALNGVCGMLGLTERDGLPDMPEVIRTELERRLVPEGMEWLVEAWPRFDDDSPVHFGDTALIDGEADMVKAVQLWIHGKPVIYGDGGSQQLEKGERVKRPVADTWERLEEDVAGASCPDVYCVNHHVDASDTSYEWAMARDIVRRAKALAGDA